MRLLWILSLLLTALAAVAQVETGEVHGRVVSSRDNEPLSLVQVQIQDSASSANTPLRAITGNDGTFSITGVPPGSYVLQTTTVDYYLVRQEFTLAAGESKNFDIVLSASNDQRKDTIVVSGGAFGVAPVAAASSITLQGEERKNLASVLADDPLRAVQSLPGVTSNNDFDSEFSLRGASFDRIGLYLDGVLLHSPFHTTDGQSGDGSLTIFNGDMTDDMTLYEGAWPVRYSDRTAGILAVDTREGNRQGFQGRFEASASNAGALFEGPLGKKQRGSWIVSFRKSYLDYILNRIDFGDQPPLTFGFTDGEARLTYDLTSKHTISLSDVEGASGVDRTPFQSELGLNTVMTSGFRFSLLNLGSRYAPNERVLITNHLAWSRERGDVENRDKALLNNQAYGEWTWHGDVSVSWLSDKPGKNTLDFGGLFRRLRQDGSTLQFVFTPVQVPSQDVFRGTGTRAGGYVQQSYGFASDRVHLTAGVRQDEFSQSPVQVTSPYASASFAPLKKMHLQLDWGQYAQFPELNQIFSTFTHSPLLPERSKHYEAVVEQTLDERTRVRVEFYDRQDRDLLARPLLDPRLLLNGSIFNAVPNAPLRNSERGYSRGAQIFLQRRTANGFTGWISYAYGHAEIRDGDLGVGFPSDYDQRHTFNAYVSRRLRPTVNVSARFTYGSGMPLPGFYRDVQANGTAYFLAADRNGLRAPNYQRTDLRLNKAYVHKKSKATLFAEVVNLTNHHNRDFDSPGPYDSVTTQTYPNFFSMFPILPSAGVLFEF
ncbi:MAG: TonB-dependent receptor [Acidobacteriia bacterium]|nr:TonB-dependent receptor [Terriglobia bacterium]